MATTKKPRAGVTGRNIRRLRKAAGLSQRALGDKSGVHHVTIADLERGEIQSAADSTVEKLATALGVRKRDIVEPEAQVAPVEPLLREFLASPWAATLKPSITDDEIAWLRGLPGIFWIDCPPTPEALKYFVEGYRARNGRKAGE